MFSTSDFKVSPFKFKVNELHQDLKISRFRLSVGHFKIFQPCWIFLISLDSPIPIFSRLINELVKLILMKICFKNVNSFDPWPRAERGSREFSLVVNLSFLINALDP